MLGIKPYTPEEKQTAAEYVSNMLNALNSAPKFNSLYPKPT
ncbi:hypothetical protein [Kingella kingae]|nr:hypothetical protein [Kingella kingae]MDK4539934.1 hypothetical protein [Kingella kingae]MDK4547119.1 hypothetical protein [Kingella kingae]MDK4622983.1 hypothetical protein [Kingella kingae]